MSKKLAALPFAGFLAFLAVALFPGRVKMNAAAVQEDSVQKATFGKLDDGTEIEQYTLRNTNGMVAKIITYGATLTELWVPDKAGKSADVVLGFDSLQGYLNPNQPYFGGPSAATPIASQKGNSLWTGSSTLSPSTTARIRCTAENSDSIGASGKLNLKKSRMGLPCASPISARMGKKATRGISPSWSPMR